MPHKSFSSKFCHQKVSSKCLIQMYLQNVFLKYLIQMSHQKDSSKCFIKSLGLLRPVWSWVNLFWPFQDIFDLFGPIWTNGDQFAPVQTHLDQSMSEIRPITRFKASKAARWRIQVPDLKDIYPLVNNWKPSSKDPGLKTWFRFKFWTWSVQKLLTKKTPLFAKKRVLHYKKAVLLLTRKHANNIQNYEYSWNF